MYFATRPDTEPLTPADFVIPIVGALCAPVALELMRFVQIDVYPESTDVISWQTLVFCWTFSLIINSFFSTLILEGQFPVEGAFEVLKRFIIGDDMGLVLFFLLLVGLLNLFRRFAGV